MSIPSDKTELYFGNDDEQQTLIDRLAESVRKETVLHVVTGKSGTGKSTAIHEAEALIANNPHFSRVMEADELAHCEPHEIRELSAAKRLPEPMLSLLENAAQDHFHELNIYQDDSGKHIAVFSHDETPPGDIKARAFLQDVVETMRTLKKDQVTLAWVADAPVIDQPPDMFKRSARSQAHAKRFADGMQKLQKHAVDVLKVHELHHDMDSMRDCIWEHAKEDGKAFFSYLEKETLFHDKTPEWRRVVNAAIAGEEEAYVRAFDQMAARAQSQDGKRSCA